MILQYIRAMENASGANIKTLHRLVEGRVEALEFNVSGDIDFVDIPLKDLELKSGILVAGIVRQNGSIVIPTGNDCIHHHDDVIIVTTDPDLRDLRDILR